MQFNHALTIIVASIYYFLLTVLSPSAVLTEAEIATDEYAYGLTQTKFNDLKRPVEIRLAQAKKAIKPNLIIIDGAKGSTKADGNTQPAPETVPQPPVQGTLSDAARTWKIISATRDISVIDRFIASYPGTIQASLAAQRRGELARAVPVEVLEPIEQLEQLEPVPPIVQPQKAPAEKAQPDTKVPPKAPIKKAKTCRRGERLSSKGVCYKVKTVKTCKAGQKLSSRGKCYTPKAKKIVKRCKLGQRLSSKGRCYTPRQKIVKTCRPGERLSRSGVCYLPKSRAAKISRPPPRKEARICRWCETVDGGSRYVCGRSSIARDCN